MSSSTSTTSKTESEPPAYRVVLSKSAEKDLRDLDRQTRKRIKDRLRALGTQPRGGPGATQLVGQEGYRVTIGRWRARYLVLDEKREVRVTCILKRDESTYR